MNAKYEIHISLLKDLQNSLKTYKKAIKDAMDENTIVNCQLQFLKISKNLLVLFKDQPSDLHLKSLKSKAEVLIKEYQKQVKSLKNTELTTEIICNSFEDHDEVYNNIEEVNSKALRERNEEIRKLQKDMIDLNLIFRDLSELTIEQGDMLKDIELNVEIADRTTERVVNDLEEAKQLQNSSNKKICCIVLIASIIFAGVGGIIAGVIITK